MDSLKFYSGPPCPTFLHPVGGPPQKRPFGHFCLLHTQRCMPMVISPPEPASHHLANPSHLSSPIWHLPLATPFPHLATHPDQCETVKRNPKRQKTNQVTISCSANRTRNGPISQTNSKFSRKLGRSGNRLKRQRK
jgi:hypothetical protein